MYFVRNAGVQSTMFSLYNSVEYIMCCFCILCEGLEMKLLTKFHFLGVKAAGHSWVSYLPSQAGVARHMYLL